VTTRALRSAPAWTVSASGDERQDAENAKSLHLVSLLIVVFYKDCRALREPDRTLPPSACGLRRGSSFGRLFDGRAGKVTAADKNYKGKMLSCVRTYDP
jgi:hypothetical protein